MMRLKDKKIDILLPANIKDAEGFTGKNFTPVALSVWAYFRQLAGKEIFAAHAVQATEEVQFIINWRDDITTHHVIRYNSILYAITRIDTFEGYRADIALYCKSWH